MRRKVFSLFALCAVISSSRLFAAGPAPVVQPGDLLAITGDSITEQRIYSVFIEDYLLMCKPVTNVRTMQMGWSGDTTWGFLKDKIDPDVLRFHPTVTTTCFGMNDGGYNRLSEATADRYRDCTQQIIDKLKAGGVRTIVLGSPGCVGSELRGKAVNADQYNKTLAALRDIDKDLAQKNGVPFADVFSIMSDVKTKAQAKYGPKYQLCGGDGIHPASNGHLVMAYAFLKAMGFNGEIGTITIDMAGAKSTISPGHTVISDTTASSYYQADIESTRYPFCFSGDPEQSSATSGVIEFFPFNDDLNRFMLVVSNPPSKKLKVTWGDHSKEFDAADLAKGVNLAAEFLDNPFHDQFFKVQRAIAAQQASETTFVKTFCYNLPAFKELFEEKDRVLLDRLFDSGVAKDKTEFKTAAALVTPVRYSLRVEAVK